MRNHFCDHCKVSVSDDLRYCPLCGKYVLKDEKSIAQEGINSYPIYDLSYIYRAKWLKIVRDILIFVAALVTFINILFKTDVFWFPYVLAGLVTLWLVLFYPFKEGQNHIKRIPVSGLIIALLLVFFDVYDHIFLKTTLGWALFFAGPSVLTATAVLSLILALSTSKYDTQLIRGILYLVIISIIIFVLRVFIFKGHEIWPIFMFLVSASASLFILLVAKKRRMVKEINRNFHI